MGLGDGADDSLYIAWIGEAGYVGSVGMDSKLG